jgi:PAS domain S-box-containing protein
MTIDKETNLLTSAAELRGHAEARLQAKTAEAQLPRSKEATQRLVNELEIYQIEMEEQNTELRRAQEELENQQVELEMQNEELQRVQGDLEFSRNKYSELYDFAPVGYFTFDATGMIQNVNLTGAQMLGIERSSLVDRSFNTFIADPDGREIFSQHLASVLRGSEMQRCEIKLTGKKGTVLYGQLQSVTVDDSARKDSHVLSSIVDGTVAQRLGAEVQDAREYAENIVETVRKPLVVLDFDLKILTANHSFYETFHVTHEETIGHFIYDLGNRQWDLPRLRILFENILPHDTVINDYEVDHEFPGIGRKIILLNARQIFRKNIGSHIILLAMEDITARKQAEEELLKAGALQRAIFNSANFSSIATDAKGVIQIFNVGAERMLGYTAAEVMNQITPADISDPQEVIARAQALSIELDTPITPGFDALVFKARRGIEDIYELTYIRKDGSRFPAVVSVTALRNEHQTIIGYLLIGTDNTARKQAEEALLQAGALQSAIFNSANFSSIATDAKGVIQIFNVGAERMLGYTAAEVMNQITPADISDPQEVIARAQALSIELDTPITPGFEALVFKASRGIEDIYELTYIRKDGSRFPAVVSVTALRDVQDVIIGYLLIGTDNTARKQVEAERARLDQVLLDKNAELEIAKSVAEKANLAKSDFLSSMSHELRTPLGAILGFAQLLESGTPPPIPAQKRSIDQILKAGWYLLELINEILDLALIESGKLSLSLEPVSLQEVMQECEVMVEPQAQQCGINVTFTRLATPYFVNADWTRVKQLLINLLSNAIKYNTEGGSVAVNCTLSPPDAIRISVRDTGAGLAPEQIAQLFQPFNRLGQEAHGEQGTGIGLVVCKRLVELMDGVIGVESTVGEGSVFWLELKQTTEPQAAAHAAELAKVAQAQTSGGTQLYTVLYVEDNPANLMLVEDILARRPDIRLLSARDAITGIKMTLASLPDVVLMDINLPGISGIEALQILAENPTTAHIPVVALSANAIPSDIEKGLEAGFFRYLTKPIKVNQFMETLDMVLKHAKTEAALAAKKEDI